MEFIANLADDIEDEIRDAEKYAKRALHCKWRRPDDAMKYFNLANQELGHMNILHDMAVAAIKKYQDEHGDPPDDMMEEYDKRHEKAVEMAADVYCILGRFSG